MVLDDCDALARSEVAAGISKMAWGPTRTVVWDTVAARRNEQAGGRRSFDEHIPPRRFHVRCRLIWLTNIDFGDSAANVADHMTPHFRAMCSRGLHPIWIDTSNTEDLFRYCVWLGTEGNMLRNLQMRKPDAEQAVAWFIENRNRLKEISPRQLLHAATLIQGRSGVLLNTLLSNQPKWNIPAMRAPKIIGGGKWA